MSTKGSHTHAPSGATSLPLVARMDKQWHAIAERIGARRQGLYVAKPTK